MSAIIREIQKNSAREAAHAENERHSLSSPKGAGDTKGSDEDTNILVQFWNNYKHAIINCASVVAFYGVGIAWYHNHEKWSYLECLYFITVTCKTSFCDFFKIS